ncbi:MAG TPA: lytic transglycosylase domain-containing protein [Thermoanaerobaculia bacterium]|jgi:soluble lytic murein transglycosylase-like protein|nr:lytic transglycosylase domain-containing protein [Thermoanaerobaculia bacterium]
MFQFTIPAALALAAFLCAVPGRAELIIFSDGRVTKAAGYQVVEDELEIQVRGGGSYRVDMGLVDRIVEDEVEVSEVEVNEVAFDEKVAYDLSYKEGRKPLFGTAYDAMIESEAKKHGVDASLISAVIRAESNYEPRALSRKGARGLMQLMPATAQRLEVRRPFDPAANVSGGVRYLRELAERFHHRPELVLAAYNAGERAVENYGGVPPYRETIGYVKKILSWWTPALAATVVSNIAPASSAAPGPREQ